MLKLLGFCADLIGLLPFYISLFFLKKLFSCYRDGEIFTPRNAILYRKLGVLYLVVTGSKDSIIDSSDAFVRKAKGAGEPVTYMCISDMDYYIRKRGDVVKDSFDGLKQQLFSYYNKNNILNS